MKVSSLYDLGGSRSFHDYLYFSIDQLCSFLWDNMYQKTTFFNQNSYSFNLAYIPARFITLYVSVEHVATYPYSIPKCHPWKSV